MTRFHPSAAPLAARRRPALRARLAARLEALIAPDPTVVFRSGDGRLTPAAWRALRDWGSLAGVAVTLLFLAHVWGIPGYDSYAYWSVDPSAPYRFDGTSGQFGAFRYSPAAAQLFGLLGWIPWPVFVWGWLALLLVALVRVAGEWSLAVLAAPTLLVDLYMGNIEVLLALAIVLGVRRPALWAFVLLTKVTPGVGLLWFAIRRDLRGLVVALGTTGLVVAVSALLAPDLWLAWPRSLLRVDGSGFVPLLTPLRLLAAVALVAWGARTDRPWTLVVAGTLALVWLDPKTSAVLVGLAASLPSTAGAPAGSALEAVRRLADRAARALGPRTVLAD